MKDFLFANPFLSPPGGGEGVANWMIEALCSRGEVTVLTWDPPDYHEIDLYYGTALSEKKIDTVSVAPGLRSLLVAANVPHRLLKLHWLMRRTKQMRPSFRHCISALNELDLGPPSVQYIHHPTCSPSDWLFPPSPFSEMPLVRTIWKLYCRVCLQLSGLSLAAIRQNFTVSNSYWSGRAYQSLYSAPVHRVLYPPPLGRSTKHSGASRREAFLSIGNVSRMKQWPKLVAIIDGVRELGHDVGLTLVGNRNDDLLLRELRDMQADGRPWLELKLNLPRTEVDRLIGSHKYGIHGMHFEHYGMAVAELVLGGCLTFVHDSGGQVEIVCQQEARYSDVEDAVAKLHLVLSSPEKQAALISAQQKRRVDITRERFLSEFHRLMDDLEQGHLEAVNLEP